MRWGFDDARYVAEFARHDVDALYAAYFELVGASAETGLFDTIGHSDLIKKFGQRATRDLGEAYARLASRFGGAGVCVEVNTAGLRKPVGEIYPHPDLLRAYHAEGVPVTFGSDAHAPGEVAADLSAACALAREAGYTEFVRYERRQKQKLPLPL